MIATEANLEKLRTGFSTLFAAGLKAEPDQLGSLIEVVNSTAKLETYGFLDAMPNWRKWVGKRRVKSLGEKSYKLENDKYEISIALDIDQLSDDNLGLYPNIVRGWGVNAGKLRAQLVFDALKNGHARACYDDQNFFDTDHPMGDGVVANMSAAGGSQPWYLIDASQPLKPILYQDRLAPTFSMVTNPNDSGVFDTDEYKMGAKARGAAGYTYWQMAYRSTQALNAANYQAARDAMMALKDDEGEPLGIMPTHIVVGVSNHQAAKDLFAKPNLAGGESNVNNGEVIIQLAKRLP